MSDREGLLAALTTGIALGGMFYGGLWWTVRRGVSSKRPALLFTGSLLLRMTLALAGFYLVADGRWERVAACLIGFLGARFAVVRWTRGAGEAASPPPAAPVRSRAGASRRVGEPWPRSPGTTSDAEPLRDGVPGGCAGWPRNLQGPHRPGKEDRHAPQSR